MVNIPIPKSVNQFGITYHTQFPENMENWGSLTPCPPTIDIDNKDQNLDQQWLTYLHENFHTVFLSSGLHIRSLIPKKFRKIEELICNVLALITFNVIKAIDKEYKKEIEKYKIQIEELKKRLPEGTKWISKEK